MSDTGTETALTTPRKYTGLQARLGRAGLQGISAVTLIATDLAVKLNKTSVVDDPATVGVTEGQLLNWSVLDTDELGVELTAADAFQIGGSLGLSVASVVYASASFNMSRTAKTGVDDPDSAGTLNGQLLTVSISQAQLLIGSGASLDDDPANTDTFGTVTLPAPDDATAVGF